MHADRPTAPTTARFTIALVVSLGAGCSRSESDRVAAQVRADLPAAAQMSKRTFDEIARSAVSPGVSDPIDQPLSALLLRMHPDYADSPLRSELDAELHRGPPHELASAYRDGPGKGQVSIVQSSDIQGVTVELDGDVARGIVTISVPKAFDAKVHFLARRHEGVWRIEQLSFPAWGAATTLENGVWVASGSACCREFEVKLPIVEYPEPPLPAVQRIVLYLGAGRFEGEPFVARGATKVSLGEVAERLDSMIADRAPSGGKRSEPTLVVRADRESDAGALMVLLQALRKRQVESVRLGANRWSEDSDDGCEIPVVLAVPVRPDESEGMSAAGSNSDPRGEPVTILLRASAGRLHAISVGARTEPVANRTGAERLGWLKSLIADLAANAGATPESPLRIAISANGRVTCGELVEVAAAVSGMTAGDGRWKRLPVAVLLDAPRALDTFDTAPIELEPIAPPRIESAIPPP